MKYFMRGRILIVDDDGDTREALAELLSMEGFEVLEAGDGSDAFERLRTAEPPDLILLDLVMPKMDGWQLHAEILKDESLAPIPVVVMTAAQDKVWRTVNVREVLKKPFTLSHMLEAISRHCGTARSAQ